MTEFPAPADATGETDVNSTDLHFSDLGLPEDLLAAVTDLGFVSPTAIQASAIPLLLAGRDVVGVAQTGTGKTAAFALPLLAHVDPQVRGVQALVLAPTRELAMQGAEAVEAFAARSRGVTVAAVYGGAPYGPQLRALEEGAQVVVGTPGRIMDLMDRGALELAGVRYFVLDEADEMLRMGFAEDVDAIAQSVPDGRVCALFSATMPPAIRRVAERHLSDAEEVTISRPATTVSTVAQKYAVVPERHKIAALARILAVSQADAALVFVRTRATAEDLAIELGTRGVATAALSGDVVQKEREKLVARLREGTLDVLVATDVAARGLDVERIGLVVNFDVPREADTYVHRIGRTGRAGRTGESLTFVTPKERPRLRRIEKQTGSTMEQIELPTPAEVSRLRAERLVEQALARHANGRLSVYREVLDAFDMTQSSRSEPLTRDDLLAALLALAVRDPGPTPGEEPEKLTVDMAPEAPRRQGRDRRAVGNVTRYRVEVGHKDRVKPGAIVGAITREGGLRGSDLGHIDIYPTFSLVEIGAPLTSEARRRISQARVSGRALRISEDRGPGRRRPTGKFRDDSRSNGHEGRRGKRRQKERGY
ncbi:MAG: DEAD/DEAH box helicase [Actinomycetaceae bacterium]|nr:DEAD/DEAH box helicase [Actinomycetaceae bacterium]